MEQAVIDPSTASDFEMRIELERRIEAPIERVFEELLAELGPEGVTPDGRPLALELEPWPGGRWYRDLGDDAGHLWAHVQAIKAPTLIELTGPLMISRAIANNVQYRLEEVDGVTTLRLVHHAFGQLPDDMRDGMPEGWDHMFDRIQTRATG
ncbi:MAG: SRPBCC domain-containing protein [Gemmatimonadota bacterium]|nr:SRPBCC domain-containing protein [Gemmatimonadota bacterium]